VTSIVTLTAILALASLSVFILREGGRSTSLHAARSVQRRQNNTH
jgi:hypothetical protein